MCYCDKSGESKKIHYNQNEKTQIAYWAFLCSLLIIILGVSPDCHAANQYIFKDLYAIPGGKPMVGGQAVGTAANGPALWLADGTLVSLGVPQGFMNAFGSAGYGNQQVGYGLTSTGPFHYHAFLWTGSASSFVDLHPGSRYFNSQANQTDGSEQIGWADNSVSQDAGFWKGSPSSFVDLHPSTFHSSEGLGISPTEQVGDGYPQGINSIHALLWHGTASSAVDLNPAVVGQYGSSSAVATAGTQQVGNATMPAQNSPTPPPQAHAYLWTGTAASAVDLNPSGAGISSALGTNGFQQVGYFQIPNGLATFESPQACVWSGTADSVIDLGALLPAIEDYSMATAIDASGDVFGTALNGDDGKWHVIEWMPESTPEPGLLMVGVCIALMLLSRRKFAPSTNATASL